MFIISNFFNAVATVIDFMLAAYVWIIIGRVIVSWVNADPYNTIVRLLHAVTEPLLSRIRRVIPVLGGSVDLSPVVLILIIVFLRGFLVPTLQQLAVAIG